MHIFRQIHATYAGRKKQLSSIFYNKYSVWRTLKFIQLELFIVYVCNIENGNRKSFKAQMAEILLSIITVLSIAWVLLEYCLSFAWVLNLSKAGTLPWTFNGDGCCICPQFYTIALKFQLEIYSFHKNFVFQLQTLINKPVRYDRQIHRFFRILFLWIEEIKFVFLKI